MSVWAWLATFWFGTCFMVFVMGMVNTMVRAKWSLSDRVRMQIRDAVTDGMNQWFESPFDENSTDGVRDDVLPLKFKDLDELSDQL